MFEGRPATAVSGSGPYHPPRMMNIHPGRRTCRVCRHAARIGFPNTLLCRGRGGRSRDIRRWVGCPILGRLDPEGRLFTCRADLSSAAGRQGLPASDGPAFGESSGPPKFWDRTQNLNRSIRKWALPGDPTGRYRPSLPFSLAWHRRSVGVIGACRAASPTSPDRTTMSVRRAA